MSAFGRFCRNEAGSISIIFALMLVAILAIAGAAYDVTQAFQARSALQAAADGAALAAGADATTDKGKMHELAQKYLKENKPPASVIKMGALTTDFNAATKTVSATVEGEAPMAFMGVVGISSVKITAVSQVKRSEPGPLELVLALDTTASMDELVGGTRKIVTLRAAAVNLVNTVMASPYAKVGIVPFSAAVKVSTSYKDKNWVFPKPDTMTTSCTTKTLVSGSGYSCTPTSYPCTSDGIATTCTSTTCSWAVPPVTSTTCTPVVSSWNGCLSSRKGYEDSIESPTNPKYPWTGNMCAQEMMELSDSKTALTTKINGLSPFLDTYIPFGLVWAWNMLTPEEPLTSAKTKAEMEEVGGKKVIVLMTDGLNSLSPSYSADGSTAMYSTTSATKLAAADNAVKKLCANIKKDGIILYTVAFAVSDSNIKAILKNCASDTAKYFDASDSEALKAAFSKIGESLQRLRIVK